MTQVESLVTFGVAAWWLLGIPKATGNYLAALDEIGAEGSEAELKCFALVLGLAWPVLWGVGLLKALRQNGT